MSKWKVVWIGLAVLAGQSTSAHAQLGAAPASPFAPIPSGVPALGAPAAAAPVAGVPAAAGAGRTIWSFFGITPANCAAFKAKLCASQLGLLLNNSLKPIGALSGGIVPPLCPPNPAADAAAAAAAAAAGTGGPAGAQAVAAKIKLDEAQAKARIAALEYLGTVDCHYWPDAEPALIEGLRADRNECVRFAAARVMGTGCCCTKKTIEALRLAATGSDKDSNPSETSDRVKAAAFQSLQHCQARFVEPPPAPPERPDEPLRPENPDAVRSAAHDPTETAPTPSRLTAYYTHELQDRPMAQVLADARRAVARASEARYQGATFPTGQRNLQDALIKAVVLRTDSSPPPARSARADTPEPAKLRPVRRTREPDQPRERRSPRGAETSEPAKRRPARRPRAAEEPPGSRSLLGILSDSLRSRSEVQ